MNAIPGISQRCNDMVEAILRKYPQVWPVVLFGSRAKGNYREGSDIDIALKGNCTKDVLASIANDFEESALPYFVDVVRYGSITNVALAEHIDRRGMTLC